MGHIVNPVSMRIGWFSDWMDVWYSDNEYYVDYFYAILKIRLFLISIFFSKNFEKMGFFFSHFLILNYSNSLIVNIFYYDGSFFTYLRDFVPNIETSFRNMIIDSKIYFSFGRISIIKFFLILSLFGDFFLDSFSERDFRKLINIIFNFRYRRLFKFFMFRSGFWSRPWFRNVRFYFLFFFKLICLIQRKRIKDSKVRLSLFNLDPIFIRFFYVFTAEIFYRWYFNIWVFYLRYYFKLFSSFEKIFVSFYLIDNEHVTARFLSRFIAMRLRQNHTIWDALNPIRRDLKFLQHITSLVRHQAKGLNAKRSFGISPKVSNSTFRSSLSFLFSFFYKWLYNFYIDNLSFFTLDFLLLFKNFFENFTKFKLFVWSFVTMKRKIGLFYFLMYNWSEMSTGVFSTIENFLLESNKFNVVFKVIYNALYFDLKWLLFDDLFLFFKIKSLKFSNLFFNRFFLYHFWFFNYRKFLTTNRKKLKKNSNYNNLFLLGFKFHCFGRFSRKQRKSIIRIIDITMPLNTLSAIIDYAFYTIALKNSAVGIKVWLFKLNSTPNYAYKFH